MREYVSKLTGIMNDKAETRCNRRPLKMTMPKIQSRVLLFVLLLLAGGLFLAGAYRSLFAMWVAATPVAELQPELISRALRQGYWLLGTGAIGVTGTLVVFFKRNRIVD